MPPDFLNLDDDILFIIAGLILESDSVVGPEGSLPISLVCHRIRKVSLALVFRNVQWPCRGFQLDFYPRPLWPYIRRLSFRQLQWMSHHTKALNILAELIPQLPNITTFKYSPEVFSPTLPFVTSLATLSVSLTTLELTTAFFSHNALSSFPLYSGIHRLIVKQPEGSTLLSASEPKRNVSIKCVAGIVFACHKFLNHLDLPGEFFPLDLLASGITTFPTLKTLILRGYPPLGTSEIPIWAVLRFMPRLSRLEILCRLRIVGANAHRYILMGQHASPLLGETSLFPSQLEVLIISNPSLKDHLFTNIPPSLKSLSLDFIPEWENMLTSNDSLAYHRPAQMVMFLSRMQKMNDSSNTISVEELTIKMGWCVTPDMLYCISHLFPKLRVLELQGLRYVNRTTETECDMDLCVASLSPLRHLRTLKLAVELEEDSYEYVSDDRARTVGSINQSSQRWINALALSLPGLERVAFEKRPHVWRNQRPRVIMGGPSWAWFPTRGSCSSSDR